jgi:hypothetical protein
MKLGLIRRFPDEGQLNGTLFKVHLEHWYQQRARVTLTRKSRQWAKQIGVTPGQISLKLTRSKWGHCTRDGNLQYNRKIVTAPLCMIDYVVVHKVCHLEHHHHGPEFWALVERHCPDWRERREWLKMNGHLLEV